MIIIFNLSVYSKIFYSIASVRSFPLLIYYNEMEKVLYSETLNRNTIFGHKFLDSYVQV